MSKFLKSLSLLAAVSVVAGPVYAEGLGLGREALPEEVAAWNLDVSPDGEGLPEGSGSVAVGEPLFENNCAVCHGSFAEGVGNWPKLAGGDGTLADQDPLKTVGSYWPYLSTAWDYVHRSMPFGAAQTLPPDEVYAILAYILYSNDMVDSDFVLSKENFLDVEMPNADGFIIDDRPETELPLFTQEPCMENCKDKVEITMHARVLDVTPDSGTGVATAEPEVEEAAAEPATTADAETVAEAPAADAGPDPELVAAGEGIFKKCKTCHQVGEGAKNRSGPQLNGLLGRIVGHADGFKYSKVFKTMEEEGKVWTEEDLAAFLSDPKGYAKGTKMSFRGLKDAEDLDAVIAYLSTFPAE